MVVVGCHLSTTNYQLPTKKSGGTRSRASVAPMPFSVATSATLPRRPTVAEDCDPPATRGDGALAIVSACHLPRRRGRTPLATACAAHFVRGICRYGADDAEDTLPTANYPLPSNNTRLTTKKNSYNYAVFFFLKNNTRWHWNDCSKKVGGMQFIASMSLVATSATLPRRPTVATSATLPRRPAVAEDCDPPATRGDGALAIVSACQLPRRRGRTPLATACAAHFVRGICRYCSLPTTNYITTLLHGHFHDGEAPSLQGRRRYGGRPTIYQLT